MNEQVFLSPAKLKTLESCIAELEGGSNTYKVILQTVFALLSKYSFSEIIEREKLVFAQSNNGRGYFPDYLPALLEMLKEEKGSSSNSSNQ